MRHNICLPIPFGEAFLGVLSVLDRRPVELTASEEDLLESFVAQAAVVIHDARLYHDLQRGHTQLEQSQARLVRRDTLRATGDLAADATHQLNYLLAAVIRRLVIARRKFGAAEFQHQLMPAVQAAGDALRRPGEEQAQETLLAGQRTVDSRL